MRPQQRLVGFGFHLTCAARVLDVFGHRGGALLHGVRELVSDQARALRGGRIVFAVVEVNVVTQRHGIRAVLARHAVGRVDAHMAEVRAEMIANF